MKAVRRVLERAHRRTRKALQARGLHQMQVPVLNSSRVTDSGFASYLA
jgi:hypothetical protein